MGPLTTVAVTPGSSWAWASVNHREMWNYDSLFIWISDIGADVSYGYDEVGTPDGYGSDATQKVWTAETRRYLFRVVGKGFTPGDLPVSGTVNAIVIPNVASIPEDGALVAAANKTSYATLQRGAGQLVWALFAFRTGSAAMLAYVSPQIEVDGVQVLPTDTFQNWHDTCVSASSPGICWGVWDTTSHYYSIIVKLPLPFQRSIRIGFKNAHASSQWTGYVGYIIQTLA